MCARSCGESSAMGRCSAMAEAGWELSLSAMVETRCAGGEARGGGSGDRCGLAVKRGRDMAGSFVAGRRAWGLGGELWSHDRQIERWMIKQ